MAKFKFQNLKFEQIMKGYATILETTIPDAVHMSARLLCVELARRTQPFGNKTGEEKISEKAIAKDIYGGRRSSAKGKGRAGLFAHVTPRQVAYADNFSSSDYITVHATKGGSVYGIDRAHFLPDASTSDIASIHRANFVNGKMSAAGGDTHNIGRWKFINKYFVPKSALEGFVAAQYAKVGIAKSGWAWCAKQLKKVGSGSMTRGIPKWVTRHLGDYGLGQVEDKTSNTSAPTVFLTNTCRYADKVLRETEKLKALDIVAGKMKKQMETILKKRKLKLQEAA
jgi:hypothetical protein